jgi:hypothetical protein
MNRLIIIGNGFDLAHGLKTRYSDFMLDYVKKAIIKKTTLKQSDELIFIKGECLFGKGFAEKLVKKESLPDIKDFLKPHNVHVLGQSLFINLILKNIEKKNWVNIEGVFFEEVLRLMNRYLKDESAKDVVISDLKELNSEMKHLSDSLAVYLKDIEKKAVLDFESKDCRDILRILKKGLSKRNSKNPFSEEVTSTLVLNFNYTNIANMYCKELESEYLIREIPLHGRLNDIESIVFGFGDEVHKSYQEIEDLDENLFFEHIKSFKYFQNQYYQDLMAFLKSGQFEVFVLGHSLGLSDRTMLQAIFNSDELYRVKIFFYQKDGKNNFVEMTHQLSRHFTDKNRMRTKVVPFDKSEPLPQFPILQENP